MKMEIKFLTRIMRIRKCMRMGMESKITKISQATMKAVMTVAAAVLMKLTTYSLLLISIDLRPTRMIS